MSAVTLGTLKALQSQAGADLLAQLATADLSDENTLRLLTDLRKKHPADIAAAALETARLRIKGHEKFSELANRMFFTREALEQATDIRISRARFAGNRWIYDSTPVADLCCSIGADSVFLAACAPLVVGVDRDPLRLAIAVHNTASLHGAFSFVQSDLMRGLPLSGAVRRAFFDPARRTANGRLHHVSDYLPPLELIDDWKLDALAVKLSPGVKLDEIARFGGQVEFLSLGGELKEATLWIDRTQPPQLGRLATLVGVDGAILRLRREKGIEEPTLPVESPRGYLYEPDPAILRAGLVQDLGAQIGGSLLDRAIAFLTTDSPVDTPFARQWVILDWMPFNLKHLRAYLRAHNVGRITVKKRGSPILPEELIAKLKLPGGGEERIIVLTHVQDRPAILICQPQQAG